MATGKPLIAAYGGLEMAVEELEQGVTDELDMEPDQVDDVDADANDESDEDESEAAAETEETETDDVDGFDEPETPTGEAQEAEDDGTKLVKQLRAVIKEKDRKLRDLTQTQQQQAQPQVEQLPPKPTIEECGWDHDEFERRLDAWHTQRRSVEQKQDEQKKAQEAYLQKIQQLQNNYNERKTKLKVAPEVMELAEEAVVEALPDFGQAVLLKTKEPERLILALGKSPETLRKLAAISDPVDFVMEVKDLESKLTKAKTRQAPPPPERRVERNGTGVKSLDALLDRARKTGNYTDYYAAKAKQAKGAK